MEELKKLNINEVLKVEQMPKVFENLEKIGEYLEKTLKGIEDIECTETNKIEVKNKRTLINNTKTVLENKRKEIKNKILEPYNLIEEKYKNEIMGKIDKAIATLDDKISFIEDTQKEEIKEKCERYFSEYALSKSIDFITFKDMNLKITLGLATAQGSLTKKTQNAIDEFIDQREKDVNLINTLEHSDEILIEYKKTLKCADSIALVMDRHKELEELQSKKEEQKEEKLNDEVMLNKIESLSAPKIVDNNFETQSEQQIYEAVFKVLTSNKACLKEIKEIIDKYNAKLVSLRKEGDMYYE